MSAVSTDRSSSATRSICEEERLAYPFNSPQGADSNALKGLVLHLHPKIFAQKA